MAIKTADEDRGEISRIEEGGCSTVAPKCKENGSLCSSTSVVTMAQKVIAEVIGTFFVIFSGCGVVIVNNLYGGTVTFPGICVTWGLIVMVMIYSVGHISGAHFNPAVTITFAIFRRFPWWETHLPDRRASGNRCWNDNNAQRICRRAYFRSIDEPSEEHWASHC
ncbi:hypothetical protein RHGRI_028890 [Rhododendron griersonianum]|uniref:Aquaporin NIP-type n=1 Tax=Rhododendron griersonianum TaxID=479676 RepID=A0AAV6IM71_9ERIC|nr:hypothetical protein RHGRI_028890 [Rhododendron griersonianum]